MTLFSFAGGVASVGSAALTWVVSGPLRGLTSRPPQPSSPTVYATFHVSEANLVIWRACSTCRAFHVPHEDDQAGTARCVECGTRRPSSIGEDA